MRYLILSDIHANREALEAVLGDSAGKYDEMVYCGDLVGYGADPQWVIDWARSTLRTIIRGNHDKACAGLEDLEWFNPAARASALWTRSVLSQESVNYLASLPSGPSTFDRAMIVHGSPLDEDEYLIQVRDAVEVKPYLDSPLTFFGHTHLQGGFLLGKGGSKRMTLEIERDPVALEMDPDSWYLVNPGSVGQPRDGDPRAAYAIYTPEQRLIEYCRVEYDIAAAQAKIQRAGLPAVLAARLATGS